MELAHKKYLELIYIRILLCYTQVRIMSSRGVLKIIISLLIIGLCWFGVAAPVSGADYDYQLQDVMNGNVSDVTTLVNGSGQGWYGDSIRVTFSNYSGQNYVVHVPIGLRLVPADSGVQTMLTAGGEKLPVPPGDSSYVIKAFCGEMHDHAPGSSDTFTPGGFVEGDTLRTLQEINRQNSFNSDGQQAVWHQTDDNDISGNEDAQKLAGGGGVSPGAAAAAGGAAAGAAAIGAVVINLLNGGGGGSGTTTEEGGPDPGDDLSSEEISLEIVEEPVDDPGSENLFNDIPPPPQDSDLKDFIETEWEIIKNMINPSQTPVDPVDPDYSGSRPDLLDQLPPGGKEVVDLGPTKDTLPPELQPPVEIADVSAPEETEDGVMIASSGGTYIPPQQNKPEAATKATQYVRNNMSDFAKRWSKMLKDSGYYVKNPLAGEFAPADWIIQAERNAWDKIRPIIGPGDYTGDNAFTEPKSITCKDYVNLMKHEMKIKVSRLFQGSGHPEAPEGRPPKPGEWKLEIMSFHQNPPQSPLGLAGDIKEYVFSLTEKEHVLYRLTYPDGQQDSFDFWNNARGAGPVRSSWQDTVDKTKAKFGKHFMIKTQKWEDFGVGTGKYGKYD